jgi:uncharacterized iron-regulated membrane protein
MNRKFWLDIHLYLGLLTVLPLIAVAVTGGILGFQQEIEVLTHPEIFEVHAAGDRLSAAEVARKMKAEYPGITIFHTAVFQDPSRAWITYSSEGKLATDPYSGAIHIVPEGWWIDTVEQIHRSLTAGTVGRYVVGVSSALLLILLGTGVWLWIPMIRGTLTRWWARGTALAWHNVVGVATLPLMAAMAVTGITLTFQLMPAVYWATGSPPFEQPKVERTADDEVIPIAEAIETARGVYPDLILTGFKEPWDSTQAHRVSFARPDTWNDRGWLQVYIHPNTGEVVETVDTYVHSAGSVYQHTFFQFHTGEFFGLSGRVLWALASFLLPLIMGTGVYRWWKKQRGTGHRSVSEIVESEEDLTARTAAVPASEASSVTPAAKN